MGGSNSAVWKLWGIKATRKDKVVTNSIIHPCDSSRKFWIIADPPHLLKNEKENVTMRANDQAELSNVIFDLDISKVIVSRREQNVLYKICCYIMYKVTTSKNKKHCGYCLSYCRTPGVSEDKSYTLLTRQPNFQYDSNKYIHHIKNEIFVYFLKMEKLFRLLHPILSERKKSNLGYLITNQILDRGFKCDIPNCHSLKKTLTSRFVAFRLKNAGIERLKKRNFDASSHTMN